MAGHVVRRGVAIAAVLLALALLVAGFVAIVGLGDDGEPTPRYVVEVTALDEAGAFEAVTTNVGDRAGAPSCTVTAFDIHGRVVGSERVDLRRIEAGEDLAWGGSLDVTGRVERIAVDCS